MDTLLYQDLKQVQVARLCTYTSRDHLRQSETLSLIKKAIQKKSETDTCFVRIYNELVARLYTSRDHLRLQSDDGGRMVPARVHCRSRTQEPYEGVGEQKDARYIQDTRTSRRRR